MSDAICPKCAAEEKPFQAFRNVKEFQCGSKSFACVGGWGPVEQSKLCELTVALAKASFVDEMKDALSDAVDNLKRAGVHHELWETAEALLAKYPEVVKRDQKR
jgi:hypothetical protein